MTVSILSRWTAKQEDVLRIASISEVTRPTEYGPLRPVFGV